MTSTISFRPALHFATNVSSKTPRCRLNGKLKFNDGPVLRKGFSHQIKLQPFSVQHKTVLPSVKASHSPVSSPPPSVTSYPALPLLAASNGFSLNSAAAFLSSPTLAAAVTFTSLVFALGSPVLLSGLSPIGFANAWLLGAIIYRAFQLPGFLVICLFFVGGTLATKIKLKQKEAEGIAEKRSGHRGAGSVWGSGAAAAACAIAYILKQGPWPAVAELLPAAELLRVGFVASLATKMSDTVSSEFGKAFGKTTYLITTLSKVPRGTEGAISVEGTIAGIVASIILSSLGCWLGLMDGISLFSCIAAAFVANNIESLIGATLQGKQGFEWLTNDLVNVINVTIGMLLAIVLRTAL